MRILEMVARVAEQAEAQGGAQFLTLAGSEPAPAGFEGGADREARPAEPGARRCLCPERQAAGAKGSAGPAAGVVTPAWQPPGADPHWRPAPSPDGSLVQDPDFTLPTTAGPLTWRLFHNSTQAGTDSEWGFGRRASFPLRLMSDGTTVTVMHEDGTDRQYLKVGSAFQPVGAKNGDGLVQNGDGTWDETRGPNQFRFHFPAGSFVSLSYSATPQGMRITHNYDSSQHLVGLLEPAGRLVTLGYYTSPAGHVQVVQDWGDRRNTLSYSGANDLTQVQGPTGCISLYGYDSSHRISSVTDPMGFQTTYTYDSLSRVASMSVAGNLGLYTYIRAGAVLQTMYTDPLGNVWTHLTSGGYPVGQIDPLGNRQTYVYASNRLQSAQNALGFITSHTYDGNGLLTGTQDSLANWVTYTRDSFDNILTEQNQLGLVTTYSYGASPQLQQVQSITDPLGHITTFGYLATGLPQFTQDPLGFVTTQVWNSLGQRIAEINALGAITTHLFDSVGNEVGSVDPLGRQWTFGYDTLSRRVSQQNPLGAIWTTLYDSRGMVQAEVDPLGIRTSFQWNAYGSQTVLIEPPGTRTTTVYDGANQAIATVDPVGLITTTVYDPAGRAQAIVLPTAAGTTTVYDAAAQAVAVLNALGYRTTTVYTAIGQVAAVVDALANRTTTLYDATGAVLAQVAADGGVTTSLYDRASRPVGTVDALGFVWTTVYDTASRAVASVNPLGQLTTTVYDGARQPIASVDALGFRTTTVFDLAGEPVALQDALGGRTTTVYDAASRPIAGINVLGGISTTVYDIAGRVSASVNALSAITTAVYDSFSRPSALVDARGFRTTTIYDQYNRAAATQDALSLLTTVLFDRFGRVSGDLDPAGYRMTTSFDLLDEPIAFADAFSLVTTTVFDPVGRPQAVTDPAGHTVTTVFDSASRTVAEVNPLGYRTSMSYDLRSSRTGVTNARGFTWTAQFDAPARDYADVDPLGRRTTLAFDARSLITQRTDGKGQVETRLYDALGRQTVSQYADGTIVTTTFDALSRPLTEANQNGIWTRTYDLVDQRLTEVGPGYPSGLPLTCLYDPVGNRIALQTWRGVQNWGYDGLNRTRSLVDIESGAYTWGYDLHGRLQELDYPNGVIFTASYSPQGWPLQGSYISPATQVYLASYDSFDNAGNPLGLHFYWGGAGHGRRILGYDAANQLLSWSDSDTVGPQATFDPAGNMLTGTVFNQAYTYTYDGADQLLNLASTVPGDLFFTSATFSYDGNGCRVGEQFYQASRSGAPSSYQTTYTWDAARHLLKIQQSQPGVVDLTNSYRPDGRRHRRTDSSGTTQMVWDEDELLAQVDTAGNLLESWSWAPSGVQAFGRSGVGALGPGGVEGWSWSRLVKARLPSTNPNPDQYAHSDGQGTILALSLPTGTALTQTLPPRPWGLPVTGTLTPFSWQGSWGYWREGQLARPLHYVRARWYIDGEVNVTGGTPTGGGSRWLSPDPLGFGGGDWNLYRYVANRPTVEVDPSGMFGPVGVLVPLGVMCATVWSKGIGPGMCPGAEAWNLVKAAAAKPACSQIIKKYCSRHAIRDFIQAIIIPPDTQTCNLPDGSKRDAFTYTHPVRDPHTHLVTECRPMVVCFSQRACNARPRSKACLFLFELGNWCSCESDYDKNRGHSRFVVTETLAKKFRDACGFSSSECGPGGTLRVYTH